MGVVERGSLEVHNQISVPPSTKPGAAIHIAQKARLSPVTANGKPRSTCISSLALVCNCKQLNTEFMQETKVLALHVFHIVHHEYSPLYVDESAMTLVYCLSVRVRSRSRSSVCCSIQSRKTTSIPLHDPTRTDVTVVEATLWTFS